MTQTINLAELSSSQQVVINTTSAIGQVGAVSGNVDINGDGFKDSILLAPYSSGAVQSSYIIYGNTSLPASIALNNLSNCGSSIQMESGHNFCSINGMKSINKDKYDDFIIGVSGSSNYAAYVYYGNSTIKSGNVEPGITIYSGLYNPDTCYAVSGAGDFNKDGVNDFIIGAQYTNQAFVIFGNSSLPKEISLSGFGAKEGILLVGATDSYFGSSVANIGDFNNDGIDDVFVGALSLNSGYGGGYVVFGGTNLPSTISSLSLSTYGKKFIGATQFGNCGYSSSAAGDFNGDGIDDFLVGGYSYSSSSYSGTVYLVYGGSTSHSTVSLGTGSGIVTFNGGGSTWQCGSSVSGGFDFNNDGLSDIIIGCSQANNYQGLAIIIYGSTSFPSSLNLADIGDYGVYLSGGSQSISVGFSVSAAGKMTNSQYDSVAVTTFYGNTEATVSIVYGDSVSSTSSAPTMMPTSAAVTEYPSMTPTSTAVTTHSPTILSTSAPTETPVALPTHEPTLIPTFAPTSNITINSDSSSESGLSVGAVVGLSVGLIGGTAVLTGIGYFAYPYLKDIITSMAHTSAESSVTNTEFAMNALHDVAGKVAGEVVDSGV